MVFNLLTLFLAFVTVFNDGIRECHSFPNYVDLTHPFANNFTLGWPINKPFKFTVGTRGWADLGGPEKVYLENNEFFSVRNCVKEYLN